MKISELTVEQFQQTFEEIRPLLQAWVSLHSVPSYVERFKHIKRMTDKELSDKLAQLNQECPDL